jgi:hypothetical protein
MYDLFLAADLMVTDADKTAGVLERRLGISDHARWRQAFPAHAFVSHFMRVHKSLAIAPTRIEVISQTNISVPSPDPFFSSYLSNLSAYQGLHRPMKTHATVLTTSDVDATMRLLHRRRVPFRLAPHDESMPFDRIWVGVTPEEPKYRPEFDGGLCIEIIGTGPLQMPPDTFRKATPEPEDLRPGGMVRVTARGFLIRNLDSSLRALSSNLGWDPLGPVECLPDEGYRIARMGFVLGHSATVDLIEPLRWNGDAGRYLNTWGPGPYYVRVAVLGLDAKAQDLTKRDTSFCDLPATADLPRRLQVDANCLDGALVEFVEHTR